MRKFNFRLQKILDIREKLELEQKNKLAKVASDYQQLLYKKDSVLENVSQSRNKLYAQMNTGQFSIQQLRTIDMMQQQADQLARSLVPEIEKKRQVMEQEKVKYQKALKDKKSMEILKEQELKKHKIALLRSESTVMDEIAKNFSHDLSSFYEE